MKEHRRIPLPLLVLPLWLAVRIGVAFHNGHAADTKSAVDSVQIATAPELVTPPAIQSSAETTTQVAEQMPAAAASDQADLNALEQAGEDFAAELERRENSDAQDDAADFAQSLASLAETQPDSARQREAELAALPPGLDWEELSKHGLRIPPADRPADESCASDEAPVPPFDGAVQPDGMQSDIAGALAGLAAAEGTAGKEQTVDQARHPDEATAATADDAQHRDATATIDAGPSDSDHAGNRSAEQIAKSTPATSNADVPAAIDRLEALPPAYAEVVGPHTAATKGALVIERLPEVLAEAGPVPSNAPRSTSVPASRQPVLEADSIATTEKGASIASSARPGWPRTESGRAPSPAAGGSAARGSIMRLAATKPAPGRLPVYVSPARSAELQAVARLADAHSKRGFDLASRSALFSARAEFAHSLGMIAQGLDAIEGGTAHVQAMNEALHALEESNDFVAESSQLTTTFDAVTVAIPHTTPVLKGREPGTVSAMQALQDYYSFAQRRFVFATGRQPAASMALHGMGKIYVALSKTKDRRAVAAEPQAIVFFQSALLADPRNFMAANELGVLLANYGKYDQAKAAFTQCLRISGQPVAWRNLAVVHFQLGEPGLAQLALREGKLAASRGHDQMPGPLGLSTKPFDVQWVDPETFARIGETPAAPARSPVEAAENVKPAANRSSKLR